MSKIAIVGCDASGKTVLISALSDYYRAGSRQGQACIMVPGDSVTRRYTDNLHRIMRINREWPQATNDIVGGSTLKWTMVRNGKTLAQIELMDFGGENFRYAFRDDGTTTNPEVVARLREYISGVDFVVITVSLDKMLRNLTPDIYRELERGDIEYDRDSEAQWVTDGLLKMVSQKLKTTPPGVVVALTQADKHRKELEQFGGPKALFEKCWPTISSIYPDLNVIAVASVDRVTAAGLPADGYRTDGVLVVMKEFVRYAFGDCDDLCQRLDGLRKRLAELDETKASADFLAAFSDYRQSLEDLHDKTAIVSELFTARFRAYDGFLAELKKREPVAVQAEETRVREEKERLKERAREEAERLQREKAKAEQDRKRHDEAEILRSRAELSKHTTRRIEIVVLLVLIAAMGAVGWKYYADRQRARKEAEAAQLAKVKAENAAKQSAAEAQRKQAETRAREIELEKAQAEQERIRLESEKAKAEQERALAEAKRQEDIRKANEAEEARKRAEAEAAQARAKAKEAELAKSRLEQEKAKAELEKAKAENERVQAERAKAEAEREKARLEAVRVNAALGLPTNALASAAAATAVSTSLTASVSSPEADARTEMVRRREADREIKYQAMRQRQRSEKEQWETAEFVSSLIDAVNKGMLERGRNLIAELSGGRKLTETQLKQLEYAKTFMDNLEKAQNDNGEAMVWIGNQYYSARETLGVVKNPAEAYCWYRKAAAMGSAQAYYYLSLMCEQGEGCRKNEALAGRFCLKSARLGNPEAMFWTGVYCLEGTHGFEKSGATAYKYLVKARDAGFKNGNLDRMIERAESDKSGPLIDVWYSDNPEREPLKPKEESPGWFDWF